MKIFQNVAFSINKLLLFYNIDFFGNLTIRNIFVFKLIFF